MEHVIRILHKWHLFFSLSLSSPKFITLACKFKSPVGTCLPPLLTQELFLDRSLLDDLLDVGAGQPVERVPHEREPEVEEQLFCCKLRVKSGNTASSQPSWQRCFQAILGNAASS